MRPAHRTDILVHALLYHGLRREYMYVPYDGLHVLHANLIKKPALGAQQIYEVAAKYLYPFSSKYFPSVLFSLFTSIIWPDELARLRVSSGGSNSERMAFLPMFRIWKFFEGGFLNCFPSPLFAPKWYWIQNAHAKNNVLFGFHPLFLYLHWWVSQSSQNFYMHHLMIPCSHPYCLGLILEDSLLVVML